MQLISDDELEKIEPLAYQGCSTEIFYLIGGLVERCRIEEAKAHAERLISMGFLDASGALAASLYDSTNPPPCPDSVSSDEQWLALMLPYATSTRPGCVSAAFDIAEFYERNGNHKEAFTWYLDAAQRGHEEAAISVGYAYMQGEGVQKNILEGARWFMRSLALYCDGTTSDPEQWPVSRESGWRDWEWFGELFAELSLDERVEFIKIISQPLRVIEDQAEDDA